MRETTVTVTLDPDVARVFQSSASVNSLLRSVILHSPGSPENKQNQLNILYARPLEIQ